MKGKGSSDTKAARKAEAKRKLVKTIVTRIYEVEAKGGTHTIEETQVVSVGKEAPERSMGFRYRK